MKLGRDTKEMPIYALVVAKGGVKVPESTVAGDQRQVQMGRGRIIAKGITAEMLALQLSRQIGRTVLDKTGLAKTYDFSLEWTPQMDGLAFASPKEGEVQPPDSGVTLFTALQEQLGLKLESTKGPVDVFVVEHVEKPTEN